MIRVETPVLHPAAIRELFDGFSRLRAMVIGDVMIDAYYWGSVNRISPEAPVPIVQIEHRENRLGGAANVALNVMALEATPVICSVIGNDEKGMLFRKLLNDRGFTDEGIVLSEERPTTVKTRIISAGQHLLRVDEESTQALSPSEERQFIERCTGLLERGGVDVLIFEDYNKGVLTERVIEVLSAKALDAGVPVAVDPKKENFFAYKKATLFKPNFKELVEGVKKDVHKNNDEAILEAIEAMEARLNNAISLVTLSERGVLIKNGETSVRIPAHQREILDVSGAGDTVISVAALALAMNAQPDVLACLANLAGGLVCEKIGVVPVDKQRLLTEALKLTGE